MSPKSIVVLAFLLVTDAAHWDYTGELGPGHWAKLFPQGCAGRYQSPINIIPEKTVYDPALTDFVVFYHPPSNDSKFFVHNNGHAIQVNTEGKFFVSNGGLNNVFRTAQFHFHWGHDSHHGSEHTINGQSSPIELHIVNWNSEKYSSISEAVVQHDGLAVLGVLFEMSDQDNPVLEPIIKVLMRVRDPDEHLTVEIPAVSMRSFLPQHPDRYYRYMGSLTTPGCFESVTWTVFAEKMAISRRQLHVFRQALRSAHHRRRRSLSRRNRAAQDVLSELGIEDNAEEKLRLEKKLELEHAKESPASEHLDDLHDPDEGHEPLLVDSKEHVEHDVTEPPHNDDNDLDEEEPERSALVDNYRPVQALHGRTVFRSFPFFDDVTPAHADVWEEKQKEVERLVHDLCPLLQYFNKELDD